MTNLSNIVEVLAKQALGGNQQASGQGGLGGILGSVLGQMGGNTSSGTQGGLGGVLGSVLGQVTGNNNTPQAGGGVQSLLIAVVPLILGWVQQQGGLQAALEKLKGAGLGSQVQSWVDPNSKVIAKFRLSNYRVYLIQLTLNKLLSKPKRQKSKFTVQSHPSYLRSLTL